MTRLKMNETDLKGELLDYLGFRGIFSYPNLQGLGSYRGLPDRVMHFQGKVVYLEIKLAKGKLSEHQLAFQKQCLRDRIAYEVIRSVEDLERVTLMPNPSHREGHREGLAKER